MDSLDDLINSLCSEKSDGKQIINDLDKLPLKTNGITISHLKSLIYTIIDPYSKLSSQLKTHILYNYLYFKDLVPNELVYQIIASIGVTSEVSSDKRIGTILQNNLLKWLISVYPFLEDPNIVGKLYGILFNYLEFEFVRNNVAHLLFLSTKSIHITSSRINELMNFHKKFESSEHIIALLILYQQHAPEEIFDVFANIDPNIFSEPNEEYSNQLLLLRSSSKRPIGILKHNQRYTENFSSKLKKRKKQTYGHLDYSTLFPTQIIDTSIEQLINDKIGNFEVSKTWQSLISDKSLTSNLLLSLKASKTDNVRINAWISSILDTNSFEEKEISANLEDIKRYIQYSSNVPDVIIQQLLLNRDIISNSSKLDRYIWFFIENLDISFHEEIIQIIKTFEELAPNKGASWSRRFFESLSSLFHKVLLTPNEQKQTIQLIEKFFQFTIGSMINLIQKFNYDRRLILSSLRFVSTLQLVPKEKLTVSLVVLPPTLVYIYLFTNDSISISEIGSHLNLAKMILKDSEVNDTVASLTNIHNSYVVDVCNILWRNKAFNIPRNSNHNVLGLSYQFFNELSNNISIYDRNSTFGSLFNIHHSTAFASHSATILRNLEDNARNCSIRLEGPLTQASVEQLLKNQNGNNNWLDKSYEDTRVEILRQLENIGYVGLSDVLFSHLKSILNKR